MIETYYIYDRELLELGNVRLFSDYSQEGFGLK